MIYFVGPLPPPVGGFSIINEKMLSILRGISTVLVFDRAPSKIKASPYIVKLFTLIKCFNLYLHLFIGVLKNRPQVTYIALSGGMGQLLDFPFIIMARMFNGNIYIHHHSFAYLIRPRLYTRVLFLLAKDATHIALCEGMREKLIEKYCVTAQSVVVVSNAAFMNDKECHSLIKNNDNKVMIVGYISNITREKGIFEFFKTVRALRVVGIPVKGVIAGPVIDSCKIEFELEMKRDDLFEYIGPVYGVVKNEFYSSLDVLIFPTNYVNEAEPLVLQEAMSYGVYVISTNRGCIKNQISGGVGLVVESFVDFVECATQHLAEKYYSSEGLYFNRDLIEERSRVANINASKSLLALLSKISEEI